MLRQGVHPKIVQERLGHATISTILDTYRHVLLGLEEAMALRFEEGLLECPPAGGSSQTRVSKLNRPLDISASRGLFCI